MCLSESHRTNTSYLRSCKPQKKQERISKMVNICATPFKSVHWVILLIGALLMSCPTSNGFGTFHHNKAKPVKDAFFSNEQHNSWKHQNFIINYRERPRLKCNINSNNEVCRMALMNSSTRRKKRRNNLLMGKTDVTTTAFHRMGSPPDDSFFSNWRKADDHHSASSTALFMDASTSSTDTMSTMMTEESKDSNDSNVNIIISAETTPSPPITVERNNSESQVNGHNVNGSHLENSLDTASKTKTPIILETPEDVPQPTANGGYTHTASSKAKISEANKGKTPWNKGRKRSEEDKARIAAGVRARNRERLLQKIADMGLTEEEYNAQIEEEKSKKEAEKAERRTAKGGYTPTEETKAKISRILKAKHKNGEIKRRKRSNSTPRKGMKHSEETRKKISESLKARWSGDPEYKENIKSKIKASNNSEDVRKRISSTLKQKWQDPEFRAYMMERMAQRKQPSDMSRGTEYRRKISESMKKKWEDPTYRERAVKGMAIATKKKTGGVTRKKSPSAKGSGSSESVKKKKKKKKKAADGAIVGKATAVGPNARISDAPLSPLKISEVPKKKKRTSASAGTKKKKKKKTKKKTSTEDTSVTQMKEENRDLYELLYGEEERAEQKSNSDLPKDDDSDDLNMSSSSSNDVDIDTDAYNDFFGDDEDDFDIDDYDPYGLDELEQSRF